MTANPWPSEIRLTRDRRTLHVSFDDGATFALPAELLRVLSPSAEVQGHGAGQRITVPGKRLVEITGITEAGNYAVRLAFSDGHDTGIFTWSDLHELGREATARMAAYEAELAEKGLSRDR